MYSDIQYEKRNGTAWITIDRPEVANAFREETIDELNDAIQRVRDDDSIYVTVLTGADGGFCAGADVNTMPDWSDLPKEEYASYLATVQDVVKSLRTMSKPSIAAVGAPAIGAGCVFALACALRVVGRDAVLREGFVNIGLVPGDGGGWLLPRLIGESKAREYLLTGRDITPKDAVEMGLAVELADDHLAAASNLSEELLSNPSLAVRRTNDLIDPNQSFEDYCEAAIEYQWECVNDNEHVEAVNAFREKRAPDYDRSL
jgi:enoyl-CoA hydratase/carnithine racemase